MVQPNHTLQTIQTIHPAAAAAAAAAAATASGNEEVEEEGKTRTSEASFTHQTNNPADNLKKPYFSLSFSLILLMVTISNARTTCF